MVDNNFMIG